MEGNVNPKTKEILKKASEEARLYGDKKMEPEHIVLAMLRDNTNIGIDILKNMLIDTEALFDVFSDYLNSNNLNPVIQTGNGKIPPSELTKDLLKRSVGISKAWDSEVVGIEHILLSLMGTECEARNILKEHKVSSYALSVELKRRNIKDKIKDKTNMREMEEQDPDLTNIKGKTDTETPVLDNFCRDITKMAEEGRVDPVIGREKEIKRVAQILRRKKKNNPMLIGEPGVGKTAIVEGLAKLIYEEKCPSALLNKRIYSLDIASVIAGTKYRGQFEGRMKSIIDELMQNPDIVLFIDEFHTIVGAGNTSGGLDVSNIMKPALARGELQVIGATTLAEYRENVEKDGALDRRFQQVLVEETSIAQTIEILESVKDTYENFHRVTYSTEIVEECVKLADRYISHKFMPDKAFDILDECGSMVIKDMEKPKKIIELEERKASISAEKDMVVKKQQYEDALRLKKEESKLDDEIAIAREKWMSNINLERVEVTKDMVNEVVSLMTGVPIEKLTLDDNKKLLSLEDDMNKKVIGQAKAIETIAKSIRRNKLGLRNQDRPQGSYIFLGKSGSGKTFLTKTIAEYIFNDPKALIRVDMSEYMEKFAVSRLVGAPPGYVGYEEGGKLTEAVRKKPYAVVLFDEIEKAHPDVFNILLQVLDEGFLTDSLGHKVSFKNTLIIMTSNIGVKEMGEFGSAIGFGSSGDDSARNEALLNKAVKKKFSPEFLNRIDDVIIFNELTQGDIIKIVSLEISKLRSRIKEMGYDIKLSKTALGYLAENGYDKEYGARPLSRSIQRHIEDVIAEEILLEKYKLGDVIKVGYSKKDNKLTFK